MLVHSWIIDLVFESLVFMDNVVDAWNDLKEWFFYLKERFLQGDHLSFTTTIRNLLC